MRKLILIAGSFVLAFSMAIPASAQTMQSAHYYAEPQSVDFGGGGASSPTYTAQDVIGGNVSDDGSGTHYQVGSGFLIPPDVSEDVVTIPSSSGGSGYLLEDFFKHKQSTTSRPALSKTPSGSWTKRFRDDFQTKAAPARTVNLMQVASDYFWSWILIILGIILFILIKRQKEKANQKGPRRYR